MTVDIPAFFERYEWSYTPVDDAIWQSSFATDRDEDFDLYVAQREDWLHFAVSPLTPLPHVECQDALYTALLQLNSSIRLVRLGVDDEGDVNLLADLPATVVDYAAFAITLDTLVYYTQKLAHELTRTATQVGYRSPLF
ncbi:MAG: hypothetical protein KF893_18480 [Caldilineaceae bacterium]|nr:hypothetical protein [Caldilineaceae bacterium]